MVHMCLRLSIYIYNAVYVLLPIMLSISMFLLLAGWKGNRGGLSQLIYHIKYQPSSTFSLSFSSPIQPPSSLTFSPHSLFFTSYHLHLSFSLALSLFVTFSPFPHSPSLIPSHFSLHALWPFFPCRLLSLLLFLQQMPYASVPHLLPALPWPSVSISHVRPRFHIHSHALSPDHVRFAEVQYAW